MTSIFASTWICRICGLEACSECFTPVSKLEVDQGANDAVIGPGLFSCTRKKLHRVGDFSPMSRFRKDELEKAILNMKALLKESTAKEVGETNLSDSIIDGSPTSVSNGASTKSALPSSIPSHGAQYFTDSDLTDVAFRDIWSKGVPLVVTDLLHKFRLNWTPEYFSTKYGEQACQIVECQTNQIKFVTVGKFFSLFGKYQGRKGCWKLKVSVLRIGISKCNLILFR